MKKNQGLLNGITLFLLVAVIISAVIEYQRYTSALDEAVVIYVPKTNVAQNDDNQVVPAPIVPDVSVVEANINVLPEFLHTLKDVRERADNAAEIQNVLDKIKVAEIKEEAVGAQNSFSDNVIEVYDSDKGVVGVIETVSSPEIDEPKATEPVEENVPQEEPELKNSETVSEVTENVAPVVENADVPVVESKETEVQEGPAEEVVETEQQAEVVPDNIETPVEEISDVSVKNTDDEAIKVVETPTEDVLEVSENDAETEDEEVPVDEVSDEEGVLEEKANDMPVYEGNDEEEEASAETPVNESELSTPEAEDNRARAEARDIKASQSVYEIAKDIFEKGENVTPENVLDLEQTPAALRKMLESVKEENLVVPTRENVEAELQKKQVLDDDEAQGDDVSKEGASEDAASSVSAELRQRVNEDINQATEEGEEAPVVLIPGF